MEINDFMHAILGAPAVRKIVAIEAEKYMKELKSQHPDLTQTGLVSLAYENLCGDDDWLEAGLKYFLYNTLGNIVKNERYHSPYWKEQRQARQGAVNERAKEVVRQIKAKCIADFVCPNGETIRGNTGTYLIGLGGAFARIGKQAGNKIAGKAMSDEMIETIFNKKT